MAEAASKDFIGIGRRKTAVARVLLAPGSGRFVVNRRPLDTYFPTDTLRGHALQPLVAIDGADKYDLRVNVKGGGPNGQAGAVRLGIARALLKVDAAMRPTLKSQGLLTRDPRMKERKKYGQPGARKRFQFSKR
ncbi:MAG TPA: 30S ribosomal protein S9 [Verrucomicrobiales bacterium]|nr:30S ribosomal protein S9 [Verrucomicrobiales bacterium]